MTSVSCISKLILFCGGHVLVVEKYWFNLDAAFLNNCALPMVAAEVNAFDVGLTTDADFEVDGILLLLFPFRQMVKSFDEYLSIPITCLK